MYLICATGYDTFGRPGTPLYDSLKMCRTVKILLLRPSSPAVDKRAKDLGINPGEYKRTLINSIEYLKNIRRETNAIELRAYDSYPLWKILCMDKYICVQQYEIEKHVQDVTHYALIRPTVGQSALTIYRGLRKALMKINIKKVSWLNRFISNFIMVYKKETYSFHQYIDTQFFRIWNNPDTWIYDFDTGKYKKVKDWGSPNYPDMSF